MKTASPGFPESPASPQDLAPHFNSVRAWVEETTDEYQFVLLRVGGSGSGILYGFWSSQF